MKFIRNLSFSVILFLACLYAAVWIPLQAFDLFRLEFTHVGAAETTSETIWYIFLLLLVLIGGFVFSIGMWAITCLAGQMLLELSINWERNRQNTMESLNDWFAKWVTRFRQDGNDGR